MSRHGNRRAAMRGMAGLDFEMIAAHASQQRLGQIVWNRRQPRAFEYFPAMQRQPLVEALEDWERGENRIVARTAGDHDIGARIERADEGLRAHLRDDGPAALDRLIR